MAKSQIGWTPHRDPYELAMKSLAVSYMSNARWHKVFQAIVTARLNITQATWKLTKSERFFEVGVPELRDLLPDRFADGRFQPVEYKWIEWVRFPACGVEFLM